MALLRVGEHERPEIVSVLQVPGGMGPLRKRLISIPREWRIVCEKFSPRPGARSWKLNELEPIRIEGALEVLHPGRVNWRKPEQRKLVGNSLIATGRFLRDAGYWQTPKSVGRPDANDVNAAIMHALGHLRDAGHIPTIEMLIEYGETLTERGSS